MITFSIFVIADRKCLLNIIFNKMKIYSIYFILGRVLIYFQIKDISAKKKDLIYFSELTEKCLHSS